MIIIDIIMVLIIFVALFTLVFLPLACGYIVVIFILAIIIVENFLNKTSYQFDFSLTSLLHPRLSFWLFIISSCAGYLFGFLYGLIVTVITATAGILAAHLIIVVCHHFHHHCHHHCHHFHHHN